jgi:hypothetical protein
MGPSTMPTLAVRFQTDGEGNPQFVEGAGKKHYRLLFEVENVPSDVYASTFELHETYYDPVRTIRPDDRGRIRMNTTSYGDYDVKVRLRTKVGEIQIADSLAEALKRARPLMPPNPAIDNAISDIQNN